MYKIHDEAQGFCIIIIVEKQYQNILKASLKQTCIIKCQSLDNKFKYISTIGKGFQAVVRLFKQRKKQQRIYAIKTYEFQHNSKDKNIQREILLLRELSICDHIIQLDSVYQEENLIHLVFQFAQYGSLIKFLSTQERLSEEHIRIIMTQLILAMDLMHRKQIVHRDIKPDNILIVDKEELKICISDFGLSCRQNDPEQIFVKCGTPGYVAPEIFQKFPFTDKSDIFSAGCLLYNLITGRPLFKGENGEQILMKNQYLNTEPIVDLTIKNVTPDCKHLLKQMLSINPILRPTSEQCLSHPWFHQDRQMLQNFLFINKNYQSLAVYNQQVQNFSQTFQNQSFVQAPHYFQNIDSKGQSSNNNQSQSNSPFSIRKQGLSPMVRISYSCRRGNGTKSNSMVPDNKQQDESFSKALEVRFARNTNIDVKKENQKNQEVKMEEEQLRIINVKKQMIEQQPMPTDIFEFNTLDFREYSFRDTSKNDIYTKVTNRIQINQAIIPQKQLCNMNQRVGKIIHQQII